MRKEMIIIFILLILVSLFLLVQCGNTVTIKVSKESISATGVTIVVTDKSQKEYAWDPRYLIQVKQNNEWKILETIVPPSDLANVDILLAYILNEKNQFTESIDWERRYGKLSNGTYRIVKISFDTTTREDVYFYSNEFKIK